MRGELFYNYKLLGDVLLVIINNDLIANKYESHDKVTFIYHDEELIGINIFDFSNLVKIKQSGHLLLPPDALIDVINSQISLYKDVKLDYVKETGFKIGKIISCEEHPESDHLHLLKVDIGDKVLDIVCGARNVKVGLIVVVATIGTMMGNGKVIKEGSLLGEKSYGMCCSPKELNLNLDYPPHHLLVIDDERLIGKDFYSSQGGK